ncbi:hypothetical protein ABK040_005495 [Willaertia magna]
MMHNQSKVQPIFRSENNISMKSVFTKVNRQASSYVSSNISFFEEPKHVEDEISSISSDTDEIDKYISFNRNIVISRLLSVRLLIILVLSLFSLVSCISIWLTGYIEASKSSRELMRQSLEEVSDKVGLFLSSKLLMPKLVALEMASDYQNDILILPTNYKPYAFRRLLNYDITITTIAFYENNQSFLYFYNRVDNKDGSTVLYYGVQNPGESNLLMFYANMTDGSVSSKIYRNETYVTYEKDYYQGSLKVFKSFETGGYGEPYNVIGGGLSIYYAAPIYSKSLLKQGKKQLVGMSKINISLERISQFIKTVRIFGSGFFVISEFSSMNVISASIDIPSDITTQVHLFNLTDQDSGPLFKKAYDPKELSRAEKLNYEGMEYYLQRITFKGTPYILMTSSYHYDNIFWRLSFVLFENEVLASVQLSTNISVGIMCTILVLSITFSVILGIIITKPFNNLQIEFEKISLMNFDNLNYYTSVLTEEMFIYKHLYQMASFLKEIKTYLPESLMRNLSSIEKKVLEEKSVTNLTGNVTGNYSKKSITSFFGNASGSMHNSTLKSSLFKTGFEKKYATVIYLKLPNFTHNFISDSFTISSLFEKILTELSNVSKISKSNLQIIKQNEFVFNLDSNHTMGIAVDSALKIKRALQNVNQQSKFKLNYVIGVSSSEALVGIIGSKTLKYSAVVGECMSKSKELCELCQTLKTDILVDELTATSKGILNDFVLRPIERYIPGYILSLEGYKHSTSNIETIFELIKTSGIENDEWMYELEQKKINEQHHKFTLLFIRFFLDESSQCGLLSHFNPPIEIGRVSTEELRDFLEEYKNCYYNLDNNLISKLERILDESEKLNLSPPFTSYFSSLKYVFQTNSYEDSN